MNNKAFKFFACLEILCVMAEPFLHINLLPLGGNHLAQIGICFGAAYVVSELIEVFRRDKSDRIDATKI